MLSHAQQKTILSLQTKKGREKSGLCLVEGEKVIETAGKAVLYTFTRSDNPEFDRLVTTETPQDVAGVARIPEWKRTHVESSRTIVILDGVQDPGNVGTIMRLCLGFNATLVLVDSADATNPKVIRSSAGALFLVPWMKISRKDAQAFITKLKRPLYRLEKKPKSLIFNSGNPAELFAEEIALIAGSEGRGISLNIAGTSVAIDHNRDLESLNVAASLSIILQSRYKK